MTALDIALKEFARLKALRNGHPKDPAHRFYPKGHYEINEDNEIRPDPPETPKPPYEINESNEESPPPVPPTTADSQTRSCAERGLSDSIW
jgi:hypothetical protein